MLDITSQKWIYTEEIANPSGNMGMNQSGQTAEKDHACTLSTPDTAEIAPQCCSCTVNVKETERKSCHNSLFFHSHYCSRPEHEVVCVCVCARTNKERGGSLVWFLVVLCHEREPDIHVHVPLCMCKQTHTHKHFAYVLANTRQKSAVTDAPGPSRLISWSWEYIQIQHRVRLCLLLRGVIAYNQFLNCTHYTHTNWLAADRH